MKNRSWRVRHACALSLALVASAAAMVTSSATERESLTLARAIELASTHGPTVASWAAERESLARRSEADALPPSAIIESDFENFAGTDSASGTNLLEATVRLSRVVELGGKAALRRAVGSTELERLTAEQQVRRTELAAEVSRRFIHVLSDQAMLATARRATELARTARDVARDRVSAGAASPATLGRADIALARAEIAQEHAEHELASSRVKLSVLWGDTAASYAQAAGDLFELAELDSFDVYRDRLNTNPELVRFASAVQAHEARIKLAQAQRLPDVSVSAGVRRLETFDDQALVASFAVPLGTRRRAELQERAARADRNRIEM
ncbi:MAG: TolC family protein, partial [Steroidobacteraceae bacterium]